MNGFDSGDLDAISELLQSPGWKLVIERFEEERQRRADQLEHEDRLEELRRLQGQIKGIRVCQAIPGILRDEIKAGLKE